jgi:hypothetical protein
MDVLKVFIFFIFFSVLFSCTKEFKQKTLIYQNNFETSDVSQLSNAQFYTFNNTRVLGRYNKDGFILDLQNLPPHNMIQVSFDLYLHDSWDGNTGGDSGPDFWRMLIDEKEVMKTTFTNRPCDGFWDCILQSYPADYPGTHFPRKGEVSVSLPGACVLASEKGSSLYRIVRFFNHTGETLKLRCIDELKQLNASPSFQACDESWSIDNLELNALNVQ